MEEEQKKKTKNHHNKWKNPQHKFKQLRKDIESFQTEVNVLLDNVKPSTRDNLCVLCQKHEDCEELPCQHVICHACFNQQMKEKHSVECPLCRQTHFHMFSRFDSSSSSDTEL